VRVIDRHARYPVLVDPFVRQRGKLTSNGEAGPGGFGFSVALSRDGNTALIRRPFDSGGATTSAVGRLTGHAFCDDDGPDLIA